MIKPAIYWAAHKRVKTPEKLGRIAFALAGRDDELAPPLTEDEQLIVDMILQDNEWMDERIDEQKARWVLRQRKKRARDKMSRDVTDVTVTSECHGDMRDSHDVTIPPSVRPSVPPSDSSTKNNNKKEKVKKETQVEVTPSGTVCVGDDSPLPKKKYNPTLEDVKVCAHTVGASAEYAEQFYGEMVKCNWCYISRGNTVDVTRKNIAYVINTFWKNHKKDLEQKRKEDAAKREIDTTTGLPKDVADKWDRYDGLSDPEADL